MDLRRKISHWGRGKNRGSGVRPNAKVESGGSDGCLNFKDPDHAGLAGCLAWTNASSIYDKWCSKISLADFLVLAGEAMAGSLAVDYDKDDAFKDGTLLSKFRDQFGFGRITKETCPENIGKMPNPENGCSDLKEIFVEHIYKQRGRFGYKKAWNILAALSGVHTIGSAKPENSGYDGAWSDPVNQGIFNNNYYKNILVKGWGPKRAVGGNPDKNQWQLIDKSPA